MCQWIGYACDNYCGSSFGFFLLAGNIRADGIMIAGINMDTLEVEIVVDNEIQSQPGGGPIGREICK